MGQAHRKVNQDNKVDQVRDQDQDLGQVQDKDLEAIMAQVPVPVMLDHQDLVPKTQGAQNPAALRAQTQAL